MQLCHSLLWIVNYINRYVLLYNVKSNKLLYWKEDVRNITIIFLRETDKNDLISSRHGKVYITRILLSTYKVGQSTKQKEVSTFSIDNRTLTSFRE